jgi:hypothetical protein
MVEVNYTNNLIEVTLPPPVVIEINNNPIAIKGDKGADGAGVSSLEFEINSPDTIWTVNHNKGYYPTVVVIDIFNRELITEVEHVSVNQVKIYFSALKVGKVIIN